MKSWELEIGTILLLKTKGPSRIVYIFHLLDKGAFIIWVGLGNYSEQ